MCDLIHTNDSDSDCTYSHSSHSSNDDIADENVRNPNACLSSFSLSSRGSIEYRMASIGELDSAIENVSGNDEHSLSSQSVGKADGDNKFLARSADLIGCSRNASDCNAAKSSTSCRASRSRTSSRSMPDQHQSLSSSQVLEQRIDHNSVKGLAGVNDSTITHSKRTFRCSPGDIPHSSTVSDSAPVHTMSGSLQGASTGSIAQSCADTGSMFDESASIMLGGLGNGIVCPSPEMLSSSGNALTLAGEFRSPNIGRVGRCNTSRGSSSRLCNTSNRVDAGSSGSLGCGSSGVRTGRELSGSSGRVDYCSGGSRGDRGKVNKGRSGRVGYDSGGSSTVRLGRSIRLDTGRNSREGTGGPSSIGSGRAAHGGPGSRQLGSALVNCFSNHSLHDEKAASHKLIPGERDSSDSAADRRLYAIGHACGTSAILNHGRDHSNGARTHHTSSSALRYGSSSRVSSQRRNSSSIVLKDSSSDQNIRSKEERTSSSLPSPVRESCASIPVNHFKTDHNFKTCQSDMSRGSCMSPLSAGCMHESSFNTFESNSTKIEDVPASLPIEVGTTDSTEGSFGRLCSSKSCHSAPRRSVSICNPVAATESTDSNPSVSYLRVSGIPGAPKCPNGATIQLDQICNHVYANSAYSPCGSDTPAPHPMRSMHSVHDMRDMHDALDKECGHGSHSYLQSCSKSKLTGDEDSSQAPVTSAVAQASYASTCLLQPENNRADARPNPTRKDRFEATAEAVAAAAAAAWAPAEVAAAATAAAAAAAAAAPAATVRAAGSALGAGDSHYSAASRAIYSRVQSYHSSSFSSVNGPDQRLSRGPISTLQEIRSPPRSLAMNHGVPPDYDVMVCHHAFHGYPKPPSSAGSTCSEVTTQPKMHNRSCTPSEEFSRVGISDLASYQSSLLDRRDSRSVLHSTACAAAGEHVVVPTATPSVAFERSNFEVATPETPETPETEDYDSTGLIDVQIGEVTMGSPSKDVENRAEDEMAQSNAEELDYTTRTRITGKRFRLKNLFSCFTRKKSNEGHMHVKEDTAQDVNKGEFKKATMVVLPVATTTPNVPSDTTPINRASEKGSQGITSLRPHDYLSGSIRSMPMELQRLRREQDEDSQVMMSCF